VPQIVSKYLFVFSSGSFTSAQHWYRSQTHGKLARGPEGLKDAEAWSNFSLDAIENNFDSIVI
jgi:hypothetical protein